MNPFIDINECQQNVCHVNSTCINIPGSYKCKCRTGFAGNGTTCKGQKIKISGGKREIK